MGWTSYAAEYYKLNGDVDRKAELDNRFSQKEHDGTDSNGKPHHYPQFKVLKSTMVGTVYYAAIERSARDKPEERVVFGMIALTSVNSKDSYNFAYKDMEENMHPNNYDCPKGILELLTPTDSEFANEWRENCRKRLVEKRNKKGINTLPIGSVIKFKKHNGEEVQLFKHEPAYQFKRPFWFDGSRYWQAKHIPPTFEIVKVGA